MKSRIIYLDGIRIISSIVVFIAHAIQIFLVPKIGKASDVFFIAGQAASYAVVVFFILSGYMVTNSIINNKERNGHFDFNKYWKDRLLRLYPPLIFSIILSCGVFFIIKFFHLHGSVSFRLLGDIDLGRESVQYSIKELLTSLFFLQGVNNTFMGMNGPLWSLGDEFFLYIIASFISLIILNHRRVIPISLLIILFILLYDTGHLKNCVYLYIMWGVGALFSLEKVKLNGFISHNISIFIFIFSFLVWISTFIFMSYKVPDVNYEFSMFSIFQSSSLIFIIFLFRSLPSKWQAVIVKFFAVVTPEKDFTYTLYVVHWPLLIFWFSLSHVWLNKLPIYYTVLLVLFILPLVIIFSKKIAVYLEDKKFNEKLFQLLINN